MTKHEVCEHFNIPPVIMEEYESWKCMKEEKSADEIEYNDCDIKLLQTVLTLYDIGFSKAEILQYLELAACGCKTENQRCCMLDKKREESLEEIHRHEKCLDELEILKKRMKD